jgi:hypothetical protein
MLAERSLSPLVLHASMRAECEGRMTCVISIVNEHVRTNRAIRRVKVLTECCRDLNWRFGDSVPRYRKPGTSSRGRVPRRRALAPHGERLRSHVADDVKSFGTSSP